MPRAACQPKKSYQAHSSRRPAGRLQKCEAASSTAGVPCHGSKSAAGAALGLRRLPRPHGARCAAARAVAHLDAVGLRMRTQQEPDQGTCSHWACREGHHGSHSSFKKSMCVCEVPLQRSNTRCRFLRREIPVRCACFGGRLQRGSHLIGHVKDALLDLLIDLASGVDERLQQAQSATLGVVLLHAYCQSTGTPVTIWELFHLQQHTAVNTAHAGKVTLPHATASGS